MRRALARHEPHSSFILLPSSFCLHPFPGAPGRTRTGTPLLRDRIVSPQRLAILPRRPRGGRRMKPEGSSDQAAPSAFFLLSACFIVDDRGLRVNHPPALLS